MNIFRRWRNLIKREYASSYFSKTIQDRTLEDYSRIFSAEILNNVIRNLTTESIVLDLGTGEGLAVQQLRLLGFRTVIGIDLFAKNPSLIVGDFADLPLKPSCVDAAISCVGLGYYASNRKELEKQFKEVRRVLKPNGSLLVIFSSSLNQATKDLVASRVGKIVYQEQYLIDLNLNPKSYIFEVWNYTTSKKDQKPTDLKHALKNTFFIELTDIEKRGFMVKAISYNYGLTSVLFTAK